MEPNHKIDQLIMGILLDDFREFVMDAIAEGHHVGLSWHEFLQSALNVYADIRGINHE